MAKKSEIAKAILGIVAAAGVLAVAAIAPGALIGFGQMRKLYQQFNKDQVKRSFRRLENTKLISITQEGDRTVIKLTKKGKEKHLRYKLDDMVIQPMKVWDKKWRLVIFDVPQNLHINRTTFTRKLRDLGFKPLQKSVWVCPYPCADEIDFLKELFLIRPFVRIVTAIDIDIQADLRKSFGL